ncbi:peptidoglycan DD-metalloendopeptidase family protein [uncultured Psychroserpens sp.]|uniref:peptidoglycan DD-metalloendopeptidase family protein n=1 Tax=uncultured Psychroserpens sp. TaxID=255436 RepID=UPI002609B647|nr:peptidoglycan DD-metalloendopeptidase family protein [uncultured Psychroserpens sp.]
MKSRLAYLLSLLSLVAYAQKGSDLNIVDRIDLSAIIKHDTTSVEIEFDTITAVDIKATHWDPTVYNPYKNELIVFPLQLTFKDSTYASPIGKTKVVTSRYGWRKGRAHKGIDIDLVTGDSVFAMFDGVVRLARYSKGHGRTVILRHYNGLETVYAHLSKYGVKENDSIQRGQYLGKGGTSGNARGSHLHLVINYKGVSINPEYLFEFNDTNTIRANTIWVTKQWTRPYVHNSKRQSKIDLLLTEEDAIASLQKQRKIYVVKRGDTLSRISARNNVSIATLCKTNSIKRNSVIKIGQKLVIEK